jgi:hypothetical protein
VCPAATRGLDVEGGVHCTWRCLISLHTAHFINNVSLRWPLEEKAKAHTASIQQI